MKTRLLVVMAVMLLICAAAWAAQSGQQSREASPKWWPGEGPGQQAKNTVAGKITAIDAGSITLETRRGVVSFAVTEQTKVRVRGEQATIADVEVGDLAIVKFEPGQNGARWARGIMVPLPEYAGKITAISGDSFTLTGKQQTWTITLTPDTRIISHGNQYSPNDLRVGYFAAVTGEAQGDVIAAKAVRFRPMVIKGVVDKVNQHELVVKTVNQRTITVSVTDATVILIRPRIAANYKGTMSDIKKDMPVNIGGHIIGEGATEALWIDALTGGPANGGGGQGFRQRGQRVPRQ